MFAGVCNPPVNFCREGEESGVWGLRSGSEGPGFWEMGMGETEGWEQLPERPPVVGSLNCSL